MIAHNNGTRVSRVLGLACLAVALGSTGLVMAAQQDPQVPAGEQVDSAAPDSKPLTELDSDKHTDGSLKPVVRVEPKWPREAMIQGKEGRVVLQGTVGKDGSLSEVEVVEAEPEGLFEDAAVAAFERWRFAPVIEHGGDVREGRIQQEIHFLLGNDGH